EVASKADLPAGRGLRVRGFDPKESLASIRHADYKPSHAFTAPAGESKLGTFAGRGSVHMDLFPDVEQISRLMGQATAPAFVLGAVAGFVSILLGRTTIVVDRIRSLNEITDDDATRAHLKSDIPRLRRRAQLLSKSTYLAVSSGICTSLLLVLGFASA